MNLSVDIERIAKFWWKAVVRYGVLFSRLEGIILSVIFSKAQGFFWISGFKFTLRAWLLRWHSWHYKKQRFDIYWTSRMSWLTVKVMIPNIRLSLILGISLTFMRTPNLSLRCAFIRSATLLLFITPGFMKIKRPCIINPRLLKHVPQDHTVITNDYAYHTPSP